MSEQKYFDVLHRIAKCYQTSDQLRRRAGQYGCSHVEELEMAYENILVMALVGYVVATILERVAASFNR